MSVPWYPVYDDATKDVHSMATLADPGSYTPPAGRTLGAAQEGDIPMEPPIRTEDDPPVYNWTYNTTTNLVEPKA